MRINNDLDVYNFNKNNDSLGMYSIFYSMGLLTSSYKERLFISTNFIRGIEYILPLHILHIDEWACRRGEPQWGYIRFKYTLFFYNPITLVYNLKCISMFIVELTASYGNVIFISTSQYNLPMHYMMRWYSRGSGQSCIGTVWQCGVFSNMHSMFILVRRCLSLPYKCYNKFISPWKCTFAKILLLIKIVRNFFFIMNFMVGCV